MTLPLGLDQFAQRHPRSEIQPQLLAEGSVRVIVGQRHRRLAHRLPHLGQDHRAQQLRRAPVGQFERIGQLGDHMLQLGVAQDRQRVAGMDRVVPVQARRAHRQFGAARKTVRYRPLRRQRTALARRPEARAAHHRLAHRLRREVQADRLHAETPLRALGIVALPLRQYFAGLGRYRRLQQL